MWRSPVSLVLVLPRWSTCLDVSLLALSTTIAALVVEATTASSHVRTVSPLSPGFSLIAVAQAEDVFGARPMPN